MKKYNPVDAAILTELKAIVGEKYVWTDRDKLEPYSHDEVTGEKYISYPEVAVAPDNTEQVAAIVRLANDKHVPIVPRGAGTGYACGAVAYSGGILLTTERLDRVVELDEQNMILVVEPGVRTKDVQRIASEKGYFYANDPSSSDSSFIGGNVATNAGGLKAVKYGTTRQQVLGVELVTAQARLSRWGGKLKKDSTGYNLTQLVVGSEGTLGIVTKAYLRLMSKPQNVMDLLAVFPSPEAAINIVSKVMQSKISPVCVEFMDNKGIRCVQDFFREKLPHRRRWPLHHHLRGRRQHGSAGRSVRFH